MDCIVHGVPKSQTKLSDFHSLHYYNRFFFFFNFCEGKVKDTIICNISLVKILDLKYILNISETV